MSQIFKEVWLLSLTRRCPSLQLALTAALETCALRLERPLLLKGCWCKAANHGDLTGDAGKQEMPKPAWGLGHPWSQSTTLSLTAHTLDPHDIQPALPGSRDSWGDKGGHTAVSFHEMLGAVCRREQARVTVACVEGLYQRTWQGSDDPFREHTESSQRSGGGRPGTAGPRGFFRGWGMQQEVENGKKPRLERQDDGIWKEPVCPTEDLQFLL